MVAVRLKHVHVVRVRLASGDVAEYHYAWRGGPRLQGSPGSPQYVKSYSDALEERKAPHTGCLRDLLAAYKASPDLLHRQPSTQRAYRRYLDLIETEFGDLPIKALDDPKVREHFYAWRDSMASTPRTADYAVGTLKVVLAFAVERGKIATNQAETVKRLHRVDRSDSIWTDAELAAFKKVASLELAQAVELAAFTGLRQSDLIRLAWGHYDGSSFSLRTAKRGKAVIIPAVQGCKDLMANIKRKGPVILMPHRGKSPWTADGLRSSFRTACKLARINRTFHDLRRTAATRLLIAGLDSSQVAMIMGWEEEAVEGLKRKYVSRAAVASAVVAKLEKGG